MNYQELLDQLKDSLLAQWERLQESSVYIQLKERYDNLPPAGQKAIIYGAVFVLLLMILLPPTEWVQESRQTVLEFEDKKLLKKELLDVAQQIKNSPQPYSKISQQALDSEINSIYTALGFAEEQKKPRSNVSLSSPLIPKSIKQLGVEGRLEKLNIRQVVDFDHRLQRISPMVKNLQMEIRRNKDDDHYYDISYKIATFEVEEKAKQDTEKSRDRGSRRE